MKHAFIFTMLLAIITQSSFASERKTNDDNVEKLFASAFPGAQHVRWSTEGEHRKVSFLYNGKGAQALFDLKGRMIGSIRNVLYADLPIKVMMRIKERFKNIVPFAMTEINREDGTIYKMFVDIGKTRYVAYVQADGGIREVKTVKALNRALYPF